MLRKQARAFNRLIFSEEMRLLPLFSLALTKCSALRGGAHDVSADERSTAIFDLDSMPTPDLLQYLHPSLFALHQMPPDAGVPISPEREWPVLLPPPLPLSGNFIDSRGVFLVDNGQRLLLWVGKAVQPELLEEMFGVRCETIAVNLYNDND
jgi:protein transport protein SEC24